MISIEDPEIAPMHAALAEMFGADDEICIQLDELVHDLADEIASRKANQVDQQLADDIYDQFSAQASEINNQGVDAQLAYIRRERGVDGAWDLLNQNFGVVREANGISKAPTA
jgi:hypothetical protein